jgi:hypothetical protein
MTFKYEITTLSYIVKHQSPCDVVSYPRGIETSTTQTQKTAAVGYSERMAKFYRITGCQVAEASELPSQEPETSYK